MIRVGFEKKICYQWRCPECTALNTEIESKEVVVCKKCYEEFYTEEE